MKIERNSSNISQAKAAASVYRIAGRMTKRSGGMIGSAFFQDRVRLKFRRNAQIAAPNRKWGIISRYDSALYPPVS
jgi:hypothetical protein